MTFSKHFVRGLALSALTVGLAGSVSAQNGTNFHVMSNGADVIYGSIGAGGSSIGGADGIGHWMDGNSLRGNQITLLGDYGYRQQGWLTSQCVLGPPIVGLAIKFPLITIIEFDGTNANDQDVFTRLGCAPGSGGALAGVTTAGFLPYGAPAGTSASFLLSGLPSGLGLPSSTTILIPNGGLVPSSNGGTATIIAAAQVAEGLPIASTGFCWIVSFGWLPSALVSADNIDGWWEWLTSSPDNNQYWNMSNDELNVFSSNTVATAAGVTGAFNFFGTLEYEFYSKTVDPSMNEVLAPVGFQGTGPYYTSPTIGGVNAGGDMGQHGGVSLGSAGGASNPVTGLPAQDLGLSGALSSFGWASWNNDTRLTPIPGSFPHGLGAGGLRPVRRPAADCWHHGHRRSLDRHASWFRHPRGRRVAPGLHPPLPDPPDSQRCHDGRW